MEQLELPFPGRKVGVVEGAFKAESGLYSEAAWVRGTRVERLAIRAFGVLPLARVRITFEVIE